MVDELGEVFINAGEEISEAWPSVFPTPEDTSVLRDLWLSPPNVTRDEGEGVFAVETKLQILEETAFVVPGLPEVSFVLGGVGMTTVLPVRLQMLPEFLLRIADVPLALRLRGDLLKPARRVPFSEPGEPAAFELDPTRDFVDITLSSFTLEINEDGNILLTTDRAIDLPPTMIGESGIVVQAREVEFFLDPTSPPAGQPVGFRGIRMQQATLALPGELGELVGELSVTDAFIGTGGFSGTVSDTLTPPKAGKLFGVDFVVQQVDIALVQNAFVASSMRGLLTLPFFEEQVEVEVSFTLNGDFSVRLIHESGIVTVEKDGVFELAVTSIGFVVEDGDFFTVLSGNIKPTIEQDILDWPTFEVRELTIDPRGNVQLEGGWLNLPSSLTLDFFGFQFEITRLGFGRNDDGGSWVGMNGALRLVEGMQAGVSVEGLRVLWFDDGRDPRFTLDGVGVEFEVANALRFKGFVAFRTLEQDGETVRRFDGEIELELLALDMAFDAELVFGYARAVDGNYNFMGIYLGVELPAGIPLFATGLGVYGMAGLFGSHLTPAKAEDEPWYGVGPNDGWYKRPEPGVTDLTGKWTNQRDALGLGVGVTLGTLADNGYAFSGRVLLLMLFPGPILMIEGRANVLRERAKLGDEPLFRTLAVLDFNAGTFLFGVDAQYQFDGAGRLIDMSGGAEAYFNLNNPGDWHFYLGQRDPRERRIRARIFQLFNAEAYFMLDARSVAMGARFGYEKTWKFGKLRVTADLWTEAHAGVSWRPPHYTGGMLWHGGVRLSAFGVSVGLSVEVGVDATVFDPFEVRGSFTVKLNLPWPAPDLKATVTLQWGPENNWPKLPLPLVEAAVEHLKVSASWPLPRSAGLLAPNYDSGAGLRDTRTVTPPEPTPIDADEPPTNAPVVPMDGRPRLTFARPMHDDALIGVNNRAAPLFERIGDPDQDTGPIRVNYSLRELRLERWSGSTWVVVARKAASDLPPNDAGVEELYGSWAPVPELSLGDGTGDSGGHAQVKLWLWSANPFDYTRRIGRSWDEWFTDQFDNYPCVTQGPPRERCFDLETIPLTTPFENGPSSLDPYVPSYRHPDNLSVETIVDDSVLAGVPLVQNLAMPLAGRQRGVCFGPLPAEVPNAPPPPTSSLVVNGLVAALFGVSPVPAGNNALMIRLPVPNLGVRVLISGEASVIAFNQIGTQFAASPAPRADDIAEILAEDLSFVVAYWDTDICLSGVCYLTGPSTADEERLALVAQHNVDSVEHFQERGFCFSPHTNYRLMVATQINAIGERQLAGETRTAAQTEYAFFQTQGPPKLADLSLPIGQEDQEQIWLRNSEGRRIRNDGTVITAGSPVLASELNDLGVYVRQTLPATIPPQKQRPDLPRPVYRAYDLGVEFDENYVQLMYRLDNRDLALYLFDQNNQPIRDVDGKLLVLRSGWAQSPETIFDEAENVWKTTLQASSCTGSISVELVSDEQLKLPGVTLLPDSVYEARLTPLLLREDFNDDRFYELDDAASGTGAILGRWLVEDQGGGTGSSNWVIGERGDPAQRIVTQTSNYLAGSTDGLVPDKPGTILWLNDRSELPPDDPDQPGNWSDYRVTVIARAEDDDAIGLVFRRFSATRYYRFSMDRERKYRRLTLHMDGVVRILAEDEFVFQQDKDYEISVEAVQEQLLVFLDGALVFRVSDATLNTGTIGLYCWGLQVGSFADVRVDDLRQTARSAFRYRFTTSRFSNFVHQLHSYQDETWSHPIAEALSLLSAAVPAAQAPTASEHRAWDAFEASPDMDGLLRTPVDEVQVVQLTEAETVRALLVRSPEPIDIARTAVALRHAGSLSSEWSAPEVMKLRSVARHPFDPNQESVALMLRDALDPSGFGIELQRLPPLLRVRDAGECLVDELFSERSGLLFQERFGPNALDLYEIVDEGSSDGPSDWSVDGGAIVQSSNIFTGPNSESNLEKLGTMALLGCDDWADVRIRVVVSSDDNDSVGIVFRYRGTQNYYRFELNRQFGYRRLIRKVEGAVMLLWEDSSRGGYETSQDYEMEVIAYRGLLLGFVNRTLHFMVNDASLELGRVGLYCWSNDSTRFGSVTVRTADRDPLLMPPPSNLDNAGIIDEGSTAGPSDWQIAPGQVLQQSQIHTPDNGNELLRGTMLIAGNSTWANVYVAARITSTEGRAAGIVFGYQDAVNYYRFSMDSAGGYRRLIKIASGAVTVLWEDSTAYSIGQPHDIAVLSEGGRLRTWFDGVQLFDIEDHTFSTGFAGLYTWNDGSFIFENWTVLDATVQVGRWEVIDQGQAARPSDWRITGAELQQRSNIGGGSNDGAVPDKLGTMALTGEPTWSDYRITARVRSEDNDALGVVFRFRDESNYYRLSSDAERQYTRLVRVSDGVVDVLWEQSQGYVPGIDFDLIVDAVGPRLRASLAGVPLFDVQDTAHAIGRVGLYAWSNEDLRFSSFRVCRPTLEASELFRDRFEDADVSDWTFADQGTVGAPSSWAVVDGVLTQASNIHELPTDPEEPSKEGTYAIAGTPLWTDYAVRVRLASGDDDAIGVIFRYVDADNYYRFSMDREGSYRRLVSKEAGAFRILWEDSLQYEQDQEYELTLAARGSVLEGYIGATPMFRVNDRKHVGGRIGLYCWANDASRFSKVRVYPAATQFEEFDVDEQFPVLRDFRWSFEDEGDANAPSAWSVEGGKLVQTSSIGSSNATIAPGTNAIASDTVARDCRVSASMSTASGGGIGLVFRASSAGYYRFAIDEDTSVLYVLKKVGGSFTVIYSQAFQLELETVYVLSVDCVGSRLTGFINGVQVFDVEDDSLSEGAVGLYAHANPGAEYYRITLARSRWLPFYRFRKQSTLPAGTRLRVFSGSPTQSFAAEPLEVPLHVAPAFEQGQIQFPDGVVDLRVVGRSGPEHRRQFQPEQDFSDVDFRVLRKGDGTAYLLVPNTASAFEPGEHRLRFTYSRLAPAQTLTERGETSDEVGQVDVAWLTVNQV